MSHLQTYAYPGYGAYALEHFAYNQAVRVGDRIICAGQGGWDAKATPQSQSTLLPPNLTLADEITQAFANVEHNLRHAGGTGWAQVYKVVTYSTDIDAQLGLIVENLRLWMPWHKAVWTAVGVKALGGAAMRFEIEVEAHDGEGAAAARRQGK